DLRALDDAALLAHIREIDGAGRQYFRPNIAISITQGLLHRTLFKVVSLLAGSADAPALYDSLTCFCDTKTNLVNRDLHALAAQVRATPALRELLATVDRRAIVEGRRLAPFAAFGRDFEKFLRDHGHREVDWDVYVPTWSGQPWVVLENVRLLAARDDDEDPAEREEALRMRQADAERRFLAQMPEELRFAAAELLRLARTYTSLDDLEHYQTTRLSVPFRAALVEAGRRLAGKKALDADEDVFFLRRATMEALLDGKGDPAVALAEARANKASWAKWKTTPPPWVRGEAPAPVESREGVLRGMPGSPGVATGKIFRVNGVEDFARFPKGAVLVARTTNPAWTPLFYSAVAVITESGGPLSHGAVTAREVGLPAVMAVRGALSLLEDGTTVRVNGTTGTVERVP
ncbi:MAG TPA: PEP-utilizing enzyme, partial [bacterium]|nr:PEP-utilizing enzyme [bacterium]